MEKYCVKMDVIIDDGFHRFDANINFLENSLSYLNDGGHYIIEDVRRQPRIIKNFIPIYLGLT